MNLCTYVQKCKQWLTNSPLCWYPCLELIRLNFGLWQNIVKFAIFVIACIFGQISTCVTSSANPTNSSWFSYGVNLAVRFNVMVSSSGYVQRTVFVVLQEWYGKISHSENSNDWHQISLSNWCIYPVWIVAMPIYPANFDTLERVSGILDGFSG